MKKVFRNIVTALDLSEMDAQLLRFTDYFAANFDSKKVHFLSVIPEIILPEGLAGVLHNVLSPGFGIDKKLQQNLEATVKEKFKNTTGVKVSVEVEEGHPLNLLVKKMETAEADLLLLGKKKHSGGSGITARKVARKANAAVCFVPEEANTDFKNILVPMDFSPYSLRALQMAIAMKADDPQVKITWLYVVDYPPTEAYLSGNYGLLSGDWQGRATQFFKEFLVKKHIPIEDLNCEVVKNDHFDVAEHIWQCAEKNQADLILIGARGHSLPDDLFFGSVTEKLVTMESDVPVLIVRGGE